MSDSTLHTNDKVVLLLALVPYLIDRGEVTAAEAAKHFGVSEAQIRAAVSLIGVSGVPGETKTYQHDDLFDIDWDALDSDRLILVHQVAIDDTPRLSSREAAALIAGLQYLAALPENVDNEALDTLQVKLARGTTGGAPPVAVARPVIYQSLRMMQDALRCGVQLEFDYMNSRGERERRSVDPLRIESRDTDWYLKGWCHLREAVRTFRLDRVTGLTVTDRPISERSSAAMLPENLFQASDDDLFVEVALAPHAEGLFREYLGDDLGSMPDGRRRWRLRVAHFHGLKRLVASHAGLIEVLAPEAARRTVAEWASLPVQGDDERG